MGSLDCRHCTAADERRALDEWSAKLPLLPPQDYRWLIHQRAVALTRPAWQPIETAPRDGRTILLGCCNSHGKWRTMRGQWFSAETIADEWEYGEDCAAGWYETAVEPDAPNCWEISPTHWMPLPKAPT